MSVTSRTRSAARTGLKVQRRVALAQVLFWPTVLTTGAVVCVLVLAGRRRRRSASADAADAMPLPDSAAATA